MEHFFIYFLVTHSVNCGRFMFFFRLFRLSLMTTIVPRGTLYNSEKRF